MNAAKGLWELEANVNTSKSMIGNRLIYKYKSDVNKFDVAHSIIDFDGDSVILYESVHE